MAKIVQLDELTINKIAAGEVIERPASVVKELVENSIDAGATKIEVEIKKGGIEYIRVTDNGSGIPKDDMEISFERHATSKIRSANDLDSINTMGFRGEALPSIAAVSKLEMISKTEDGSGYSIKLEAGDVISFEEMPQEKGTTIIVKDIFYNTPARYKFLKKDYTEAGYVEDNIRNLCLINKDIAFKLISNGKTIINTNGSGSFEDVVYAIFGKDVSDNIIEVDETYNNIKVSGVIGKPSIARSNRKNQIFYVNGRYVKDKTLSSAIEKAYRGLIPQGRFGFCILNIGVVPEFVDVNVHPAKLEVRFENEQDVFRAVYNATKTGLSKEELVSNFAKADFKYAGLEKNVKGKSIKEEKEKYDTSKYSDNEYLKNDKIRKTFENFDKNIKEDVSKNKIDEIITSYKTKNGSPESVLNEYDDTRVIEDEYNTEVIPDGDKLFEDESNANEKPEELTGDETIRFDSSNLNVSLDNNDYDKKYETRSIEYSKAEDNGKENFNNIAEDLITSKIEEGKFDTDILNKKDIQDALNGNEPEEYVFEDMYKEAFGVDVLERQKEKRELDENMNVSSKLTKATNESIFKGAKIPYKIVGVVFRTYIIVEISDEMYIIDQHAAHERVLFEKIKENYYSNGEKDIQKLLMPDVITLSGREYNMVMDNIDIFKKAGFEVEEFGLNTVKLVGVPSMVEVLNTKELFLDILDEIDGAVDSGRQEIEHKFLATVACKAAVKANMTLSETEIESLLDEMMSIDNPFTCPHGRPTAIKMTKYDIERKFERK